VQVDKTKLKVPLNTEENREKLADIIMHDMSTRDIQEYVKDRLISRYKLSKTNFLKDYWQYYEETYGHCPLGVNGA
tara:strand:+ start:511 stop:738 length:228 start_codon:yes stop_codon:yes gene_type:complete